MASNRPGGLRRLLSMVSFGADPLASRHGAASWIGRMAAESVVERAGRIVALLGEPRLEPDGASPIAPQALFAIDAAADRLIVELTRRYVVGAARRNQDAFAAWTAAFELAQSLATAYRPLVDDRAPGATSAALVQSAAAAARYLHYRALERRLRGLRFEQWIPGKWRELYIVYRGLRVLGAETQRPGLVAAPAPSAQTALVSTLLHEMLVHGSFGVVELEWASRYLRRWLPGLALGEEPGVGRCWVDLASSRGLRRPTEAGADQPGVLFLDIQPMLARLRARVDARRAAGNGRVATVAGGKLVQVLEAMTSGQRARAPRTARQASARIVCGFDSTLINLALRRPPKRPGELEPGYELRRPMARFVELNWPPPGAIQGGGLAVLGMVRDVSETGVRLALPAAEWGLRSVGELVGVQEAETTTWRIGVVRRLFKPRSDTLEVGVALLTTSPTFVRMEDTAPADSQPASRDVRSETPVRAIFVPPGCLERPALLLAPEVFVPGRRLWMPTDRANYELGMSRVVERGPDWALVEVRLLGKSLTSGQPAEHAA